MSKRAISVSDKFDSFHLSFNLDELKESLETNQKESPAASVFSNGKRLWLGDGKPEVIQNIDLQIRKRFSIPVENQLKVCLYYPPEKSGDKYLEKYLELKGLSSNIFSRFIISTSYELCEVGFRNVESENVEIKPWVAYRSPPMVGGMLSYKFKNEPNLIIPPKKGFRQVRRKKNLDKRFVMVFDYIISKEDIAEITNLMGKTNEKQTGNR